MKLKLREIPQIKKTKQIKKKTILSQYGTDLILNLNEKKTNIYAQDDMTYFVTTKNEGISHISTQMTVEILLEGVLFSLPHSKPKILFYTLIFNIYSEFFFSIF